ncbi:protein phosphatase 2C-like domain-containing protein 1 [Paroedura picta]|uniref:protein phosphatase 2C-like domain-containing protein 1 n=1 Tax=Paroedura picta TaxID=143630 RepID=UPI004055E08E
MTWETRSERTDPELQKGEEDSTKPVSTDFKKVGHLDITVLCSICREKVHIKQLFHHKRAHRAQIALGYQRPWIEALDINKLALRQKEQILKIIHSPKYIEQDAHKIIFSFNFLKESLKIAPYFSINSVERSSVHTEEASSPVIKAIAICQDRNALWRSNLEDVFVVLDNYGNRPGTSFLGLFDGSYGISAAKTTSAELPLLLLDQLSCIDSSYQVSKAEQEVLDSFRTVFRADYSIREKIFTSRASQTKKLLTSDYKWIHKAYAKSFWRMDRLLRLGRNENSRIRWSGCSAATCLVEKLISEKQDKQTQEGEETLQKISGESARNIMKQEKLSEDTSIVEEKTIIAQQGAPCVSNKRTSNNDHQEEEPLEKINEEEETTIEDSEHFNINEDRLQEHQLSNSNNSTESEDRLQEHQLSNSNNSTESEENSAGIMHIANVGNVHVVLCKNGESYWLSKEHTTYSSKERKRVLHSGGYISSNEPKGMIEGIIRTTRGLGYHGNPQLKKTVIPVPHTISIPVDDSCQFLILASNGLWEVLDKNEVVTLALVMYSAFLEQYQHAQQRKSSVAKTSIPEDFFFSWYLKPDFLLSEEDLEEGSMEENNTGITSPRCSGSVEEGRIPSGSLVGSSREQKLESPPEETINQLNLEEATVESWTFNEVTPSLEENNTEITSPRCTGSVEEGRIPSGSLEGSSREQKLESPPEETNDQSNLEEAAADSWTFNEDAPSSEDTETTSSSSSSQTSTEESQVLDEQHISGVFEPPDKQESSSQTEDQETDATTFYAHAAKYMSKHLVKAALRAGSRDNITVLIILLNGCDKIPTYVEHACEGSQ